MNIPWLELDKLDASISVRNLPEREFFVWSFTRTTTSTADEVITMWFRPKYVHVLSIYENWNNGRSESFITDDGTTQKVVTRYVMYNIEDEYSLWEWDETTVEAIYIDRDTTRHRYYYWTVTNTWITFSVSSQGTAPPPIAVHIFAIW